MSQSPDIYFLRVTENRTKLARICSTIQRHFDQGHKILIMTPSPQVATYIDDLLWSHPKDSFLPHAQADKATNDRVAITTGKENHNKATVLFNLCSEAITKCTEYTTVYELLDETQPEKERLSLQRQGAYRSIGYEPEVV